MSEDLLTELGREILRDLARSTLAGTLPAQGDVRGKRARLPKSSVAPTAEDMDARLRSIRRYITPKELAALLHWHPETVYRKAKEGMPVDRDIGPDGRGRRLKIYPPEIADWLRDCREARQRMIQAKQLSQRHSPEQTTGHAPQEMEVKK